MLCSMITQGHQFLLSTKSPIKNTLTETHTVDVKKCCHDTIIAPQDQSKSNTDGNIFQVINKVGMAAHHVTCAERQQIHKRPSTNSQYVRKTIHCQICGKVNFNKPRLCCQDAKTKWLAYCPILTGTNHFSTVRRHLHHLFIYCDLKAENLWIQQSTKILPMRGPLSLLETVPPTTVFCIWKQRCKSTLLHHSFNVHYIAPSVI